MESRVGGPPELTAGRRPAARARFQGPAQLRRRSDEPGSQPSPRAVARLGTGAKGRGRRRPPAWVGAGSPRGHARLLRGSSRSWAGDGETCRGRRVPTAAEARRARRREQCDPYSGGRRRRQQWRGGAGGSCSKNAALPAGPEPGTRGRASRAPVGVTGEERSPAAAGT